MSWRDFYRSETKATKKGMEVGIKDWEQRSEIVLDWLRREGIGKDSRILDCGCGIGILGLILRENGFGNTVGIDIDDNNARIAGKNYREFHQMNCDRPDLDGVFDVAVALNLIEHLENPEAFLEKIRKITKPSGMVILSLPNEIWFRKLFNRIPENFEHKQHWSYLQFRKFIMKKGFRAMRMKPIGRVPFLLGCQTFIIMSKVV